MCCHNFLCSHKFHKIANYFSFEVLKKKICANFQRIIELLTQTIVNKLSKIWVWDPGSEIRDPEKTYSVSRIQGSKRHRIPDPDPQHCFKANFRNKIGSSKLSKVKRKLEASKTELWRSSEGWGNTVHRYLRTYSTKYVLSLELGPPTPSPASECVPPPRTKGGENTLASG
jgi:hypothetical protein